MTWIILLNYLSKGFFFFFKSQSQNYIVQDSVLTNCSWFCVIRNFEPRSCLLGEGVQWHKVAIIDFTCGWGCCCFLASGHLGKEEWDHALQSPYAVWIGNNGCETFEISNYYWESCGWNWVGLCFSCCPTLYIWSCPNKDQGQLCCF